MIEQIIEYIELLADKLDNFLMKHKDRQTCPECGAWVNRTIQGVDRGDLKHDCSECDWSNE